MPKKARFQLDRLLKGYEHGWSCSTCRDLAAEIVAVGAGSIASYGAVEKFDCECCWSNLRQALRDMGHRLRDDGDAGLTLVRRSDENTDGDSAAA